MITGNISPLNKLKAVESSRQCKNSLFYTLQRKIIAHSLFIEIQLFRLVTLLEKSPVPRLATITNLLNLLLCQRFEIRYQPIQKTLHLSRCFQHALFQLVIRKCLITEQTGHFQTKIHHFTNQTPIVVISTQSPAVIGFIHLFPQHGIPNIFHKGGIAWK